jgi:hypothetical protein
MHQAKKKHAETIATMRRHAKSLQIGSVEPEIEIARALGLAALDAWTDAQSGPLADASGIARLANLHCLSDIVLPLLEKIFALELKLTSCATSFPKRQLQ